MAVQSPIVETACFFSNFPNRIRKKRKKITDARRACAIGSLLPRWNRFPFQSETINIIDFAEIKTKEVKRDAARTAGCRPRAMGWGGGSGAAVGARRRIRMWMPFV